MANFIREFVGARGRNLKLYDTKIVINTKKTVGSLITGNYTDGEKTIFLCDVVGVQFKTNDSFLGYLQFETSSMQMNNQKDNMFSENTFTFEDNKNGITNAMMEQVYKYVVDRIEEIRYGTTIPAKIPDFKKFHTSDHVAQQSPVVNNFLQRAATNTPTRTVKHCPHCGDIVKSDRCDMWGRSIL